MLLSREELLRLSEEIADRLVEEGFKSSDVKEMTHEQLISYSDRLAVLFNEDKSLYNAFHEEDTLDYFKSLLAFDVAYKIRMEKADKEKRSL